jgi:flavin reductase (DIM6/NTAB) family NADH-FMN oxidoreductase RutF
MAGRIFAVTLPKAKVPGKRIYPLSRVYGLLEPGPVVLLGTAHKGRENVMAMSWHTMMEFEPPLVGCVISDGDFSAIALNKTRQCTLNIPSVEIARQVVACGNSSGEKTDKFKAFGLTPLPASQVAAPMVAECWANLECRLIDTRLKNRYGFYVLEVTAAWTDPRVKDPKTIHHRGHGVFTVAGETIRLASRMK